MTVSLLAKKYGISKSTVCLIKKKKDDILEAVDNMLNPSKRRTLKVSVYKLMEKELYKWFLKQRERNLAYLFKAHKFNLCGNETFTASDDWMQRFKTRYGIRFLKITGEKLSSQPELVDPFKQKLYRITQELNLSHQQIYNADETGLIWKLLPEKTYVSLSEKTAPGLKIAKQKLTFLGCTNATVQHKLTPLIIGKSRNPRALSKFQNPVNYKHSINAWMTCEIFKEWFFENFVPEIKKFLKSHGLPPRAILLLDHAPSHPPKEKLRTADGMIFVIFMPPNVTPLIQPLDQNV
nr:jerky protein homolog-like [Onthophagus taurus]